MESVDLEEGLRVWLEAPTGSRVPVYENPYKRRHPSFDGTFESRRMAAGPGTDVVLVLDIGPEYKLFSAKGLLVQVSIGDRSSQCELTHDENIYEQCYYLSDDHMTLREQHRFPNISLWTKGHGSDPPEEIPLEIPRPQRE